MLSRLRRRSDWRSTRRVGLHRTRVDAFRVYAMLMVILGHSQFAIGSLSQQPVILSLQLAFNVVGRAAVPLFLVLAGEHLGPRLLRDRAPGAGWPYVQRLAAMFAAASVFYWIVDIAKLARRLGLGPALAEFVARYSRDPLQILIYGARPHLWFLVVLMLVVAVAGAVLARSRVRTFVFGCAALYGVGLALGPYAPLFGAPTGRIWYEWFCQSPLFFAIGVFFGLVREHVARERLAAALIVAGITMHALEVYVLVADYGAWPFGLGMLIGTVPYTVGVGLVALAGRHPARSRGRPLRRLRAGRLPDARGLHRGAAAAARAVPGARGPAAAPGRGRRAVVRECSHPGSHRRAGAALAATPEEGGDGAVGYAFSAVIRGEDFGGVLGRLDAVPALPRRGRRGRSGR